MVLGSSCRLPGCAGAPQLGQAPFQRAATQGCCQHLRAGREQRAELQLLLREPRILFAGTGSLTEDMEKQLQANSIRISVLEQENVRLRSALAKVKSAAEHGVLKVRPRSSQGGLGAARERGARASRVLRTPRPPRGPRRCPTSSRDLFPV